MMHTMMIQTELQIDQYRRSVADDSQTAKSIDRNDSWKRLAAIEHREGYESLSQLLDEAERRLGWDAK